MSDSPWTPKRFAQELYVRGLASSMHQAAAMAVEFEREWTPAEACMRARSETIETNARMYPTHKLTDAEKEAFVKRLQDSTRAAGEKAYEDARRWWAP